MVVADLHVHTQNSDGTLTLRSLPPVARRAGVSAVAITDHDRLVPELSVPITRRGGVTIVHGIELRVESPAGRIDLLGYGATETPDLRRLIDRLQADRIDRGRRMIGCVEDRLDVDLDLEGRPGIGRPHIARAIERATSYDYDEAFGELIGEDCPCYVARQVPTFAEGRSVLSEACGLVGLAHPLRYADTHTALELASELDAIEIAYPYTGVVDLAEVERVADEHGLVVTGGSDAHDEELGRVGLDRDTYRRFRARLTLP